jgi:hypothetical protein
MTAGGLMFAAEGLAAPQPPGARLTTSGAKDAAYLCSAVDMHELTRHQPGARIHAKAIARLARG